MSRPFPEVPGGYPFPALERQTLERWARERTFQRSLERTASGPRFVFFEGPPTANNVPHVGHVVTRVVKDLFPRFRTMQGFHVERKAGWDTHGLPVEIEVEKRLGFSGKKQIEEYGIAAFNRECLASVHTYERQWRAMSERVGYWMDFDGAYWTYANEYIESVWWSLAELWRQGLLVESYKIQPYCARCGTTLSSHEVAQNYKEADDPSIWTLFRLEPDQRLATVDGGSLAVGPDLALVAWTTTPWTTLANVGLAVHPDLVYRIVEDPTRTGKRLLFGDDLATPVPLVVEEGGERRRLDLRDLPALQRVRGRDLEGLTYQRLYAFRHAETPGRVVLGDYVTATEGTGLVHTAPPYGEDDYQTGVRYGLPLILAVEPDGRLAADMGPFGGMWFKDADPKIIQELKARGLMLHADRYRHNYPFCWRCDRPLLYYATKSWFVRTTARKDRIVAWNRERIAWHPAHIGEGRFGNWLENLVDWALSRRRYWGTPLPIWRCDACDAPPQVIGSYRELFLATGRTMPIDVYDREQFDPHRPFIDEVTWPCSACGKGEMRRVEDVIDAWYDSGAMPFAQHHYPFAGRDAIDGRRQFPADFIAEAIDQTRGWFYTLHVLGVLLFDEVAYRNCIVLGHVNDDQGRKMSKRLGNFVEPMAVIEEAGADALRWYFCVNNPELPSRFSARLVREAAQRFLIPLWNALSFFTIYANIDGWRPGTAPAPELGRRAELDRWILLRLDTLIERTTQALEAYEVAPAANLIEGFLDDLTNWYIRRSRDRFWAPAATGDDDKRGAYSTLYRVLVTLSRLLAPFTPFVAEALHDHLVRGQSGEASSSVHLEAWPKPKRYEAQLGAEEAESLVAGMAAVQRVVGLGRAARNEHGLRTRQPLRSITLVSSLEPAFRAHVERFADLFRDELNVKEIRWADRRTDFVRHQVTPNFRVLGKRLGALMPRVKAALASADGDELAARLESGGSIELAIDGQTVSLGREEVEVRIVEKEGMATAGDRELLVALDTAITPDLRAEGWAREIVNRIQTARKEAELAYTDRIRVPFRAAPDLWQPLVAQDLVSLIERETLSTLVAADATAALQPAPIDDHDFAFSLEVS